MSSVFGNVALGYVVIETARFADWRRFGRDAVGMQVDDISAKALRFRLDEHQCRFLLQRGNSEDVTALGWQAAGHDSFDEICRRVRNRGVPVSTGSDDDAALRGVERLIRFPGPNGLTQEVFTRARLSGSPDLLTDGFVTGEYGLGHVALTTTRPQQVRGYFDTVFDARLSDLIDETMGGVKVRVRFLRVNRRHHSVAIAAVRRLPINPIRTRVQHVNVQVAGLDDLTAAYERTRALGFGMALAMGQHTNDRELSFYAVTPSGFEWEVGWNPLVVDEETWTPSLHQGISIWGHTRRPSIGDRLEQVAIGARSLRHREDIVPALAGTGIADQSCANR